MKVTFRAVAVAVMLTLAWAGPLAPWAVAQQPATPPPPPARTAPPPPPGQSPEMFQEQLKQQPEPRGIDAYDVGAVAATVLGLPFKAVICAFGTAIGLVVFGGTFASQPEATARIIEEGCGGKAPWIVRGSDLRPRPSVSRAFEWETHRFEWER